MAEIIQSPLAAAQAAELVLASRATENAFSSDLSPLRRASFGCVNQNSIEQKRGEIGNKLRARARGTL